MTANCTAQDSAPYKYGVACQSIVYFLTALALFLTIRLTWGRPELVVDLSFQTVWLIAGLMICGFLILAVAETHGGLSKDGSYYGQVLAWVGAYTFCSFLWVPLIHLIVISWS